MNVLIALKGFPRVVRRVVRRVVTKVLLKAVLEAKPRQGARRREEALKMIIGYESLGCMAFSLYICNRK